MIICSLDCSVSILLTHVFLLTDLEKILIIYIDQLYYFQFEICDNFSVF